MILSAPAGNLDACLASIDLAGIVVPTHMKVRATVARALADGVVRRGGNAAGEAGLAWECGAAHVRALQMLRSKEKQRRSRRRVSRGSAKPSIVDKEIKAALLTAEGQD